MNIKQAVLRALQKLWRHSETKTTKRVFWLVAVVSITVFGIPVVVDAVAHVSYRGGDYGTAQKLWRLDAMFVWHDKDVPPANAGVSYYKAGMLSPAVDQLEIALKRAAPQRSCRIRWNLAIVLDARATERTQSQANDAVGDYARAINVLDDESCMNDPQYKDQFQQLSDSLNTKMQALIKQISEQHQRPADEEKKDTKPTTDEDRTKEQNKQQVEYQNRLDRGRYDNQTDEEKNKSYSEKAW